MLLANEYVLDDIREIVSIADTEELAIIDMKAQILAITLPRGEKLTLLSFRLDYIEA